MGSKAVSAFCHPIYRDRYENWVKYRLAFYDTELFKNRYIKKINSKEDKDSYSKRKSMAYCPGLCRQQINLIRNKFSGSLRNVVRIGPDSYEKAIQGLNGGVDLHSKSMNSFMIEVFVELLVMGRVGVFVDMPPIPKNANEEETRGLQPYLYTFCAENICYWKFKNGRLVEVVLRDCFLTDELLGTEESETYRHIYVTDVGVSVDIYGPDQTTKENPKEHYSLDIREIPIVIFDISNSVIADAVNMEIALMNLMSASHNYQLSSCITFYTEQSDGRTSNKWAKSGMPMDAGGPDTEGDNENEDDTIKMVNGHIGRSYPRDLERPGFIAPPSDPIKWALEYIRKIEKDIADSVQASLDALGDDDVNGLNFLSLVLEEGERAILRIWQQYVGRESEARVVYPELFNTKSKHDELEKLRQCIPIVNSPKFRREASKQVANLLLSNRCGPDTISTIHDEIDDNIPAPTDPTVLERDVETGILAKKYASEMRGYPKDNVEVANKEQAERLAMIEKAQMDKAARGVNDKGMNPDASSNEKENSRDTTTNKTSEDLTRGSGKTVDPDARSQQ